MSCYICGRNSCTPAFHSADEQRAYERAEEAYEKYLEVRAECERAWCGDEDI